MEKLKKVWSVVSTVLVVIIVLCAVFLMGSRLLGFQVYTIISGSMEPAYMVGDLVYVRQIYSKDISSITDKTEREQAMQEKIDAIQTRVDNGELAVGDAISFVLNEELVVATHRIQQIDVEKHRFYTKGDANDVGEWVRYENVIGEVKFSLPQLGRVSNFIQNPPGMYITIAAGAVMIVLVFLPDFLPKKKQQEVDEENAKLKAELEALKAQLEQKEE